MSAWTGFGKLLALLFWLVVLASLLHGFTYPFSIILPVLGGFVLLLHLLELRLLGGRKRARDVLQVLLFGVFHLQSLPQPIREEGAHA
ncbi:MAG: hypothetical protein GAK43_01077 [Stenotrophomonas maltophilia]|nr:MAG: hypothetical protein GAK43_01077 [Stenotrophomonas maltophilia]